jgi:hypothetical protein
LIASRAAPFCVDRHRLSLFTFFQAQLPSQSCASRKKLPTSEFSKRRAK